jgi:hypothetical protein
MQSTNSNEFEVINELVLLYRHTAVNSNEHLFQHIFTYQILNLMTRRPNVS